MSFSLLTWETYFFSSMSCFLIFFIATTSPVSLCLHMRTSPNAPRPIMFRSSKSLTEIFFLLFMIILKWLKHTFFCLILPLSSWYPFLSIPVQRCSNLTEPFCVVIFPKLTIKVIRKNMIIYLISVLFHLRMLSYICFQYIPLLSMPFLTLPLSHGLQVAKLEVK